MPDHSTYHLQSNTSPPNLQASFGGQLESYRGHNNHDQSLPEASTSAMQMHPDQGWPDADSWEAALLAANSFYEWPQGNDMWLGDQTISAKPLSQLASGQLPLQSSHGSGTTEVEYRVNSQANNDNETWAQWAQWLDIATPAPAGTSRDQLSIVSNEVMGLNGTLRTGLQPQVGAPATDGAQLNCRNGEQSSCLPPSIVSNVAQEYPAAELEESLPQDEWQTGDSVGGASSAEAATTASFSSDGPVTTSDWMVNSERLKRALQLEALASSDPETHAMLSVLSIAFLKSSLHLYFSRFHPTFPVIHKPTFDPHTSPAYLCLMMIAIGSTFIGTQATSTLGSCVWRRVHHLMVNTREARLVSESSRVEFVMAGLLGQTFGLLNGGPAELLTAESFHGGICSLLRRSGIIVSSAHLANPVLPRNIDLSGQELALAWRKWANLESLRRVLLGLIIHAAEIYQFSSIPGQVPRRLDQTYTKARPLFEAPTAASWKSMFEALKSLPSEASPYATSSMLSDVFYTQALLGQTLIEISDARELPLNGLLVQRKCSNSSQFYAQMLGLAEDCQIPIAYNRCTENRAVPVFRVLWHYCCVDYWSNTADIDAAAGRYGRQRSTNFALERLRAWTATPGARLAGLHAAAVLVNASDIVDGGLLVPRAVFRSALLLFCILSLSKTSGEVSLALSDVTDWQAMAGLCHQEGTSASLTSPLPSPAEEYVLFGGANIAAPPYLAGLDRQTEIVNLLSRSMRLLGTMTQWGLGEILASLLAKVSLDAQGVASM